MMSYKQLQGFKKLAGTYDATEQGCTQVGCVCTVVVWAVFIKHRLSWGSFPCLSAAFPNLPHSP